jgi:hypothetical protein
VAGAGLAYAVSRARLLPRWTGIVLIAGVLRIAISQTLPEAAQLISAGIRDLGFAGMGASPLRAIPPFNADPTG